MKRYLIIAVTAAVLTGCATPAEIKAAHGRACAHEGHAQGTTPYNQCIEMKQSAKREAMQGEHQRAQQRMMRNMRGF